MLRRSMILITQDIANIHGVPVGAMFQKYGTREHSYVRWLAMRQIREERGLSYTQIGHFFHIHHTTVMNGIRRLKDDPTLCDDRTINRRERARVRGRVVR